MHKKKLWKDIRRSVTGSWGRFFSILSLMALGTFAFVGLKVTGPDMRATAENFYDQTNLADMTLTSTWGLDDSDQDLLAKADKLDKVEYGYLEDVTVKDTDTSMRIFSAPEDLSQYEVVKGNMPQNKNEIVLDYQQQGNYKIGDEIKLSQEESEDSDDNEESAQDILDRTSYKVVGFVKSSEITETSNIGQTTVGTGQLDSYGVVPEENFDSDVYMIARMDFSDTQNLNAYSDNYDRLIRKHQKSVEELFADQDEKRLNDVKEDQQKEIDDGWDEINDTKQELADAQSQLEDAKDQIQDAQAEIDDNQAELDEEVTQAQSQIDDSQQQLEQGRSSVATAQNPAVAEEELRNKEAELTQAKNNLANEQAQGQQQLDQAQEELADQQEEYEENKADYEDQKQEADEEIPDKEQDLRDAQDELDDLEAPDYTFEDRKDGNPGYKQYLENSQRVDILSNIFPVFLFAIAVLVSLTTMTRFVDEERINSGTLKALGYSNWDVKKKFVVYGIISSALGALIGTALGHTLLPTVIFEAYAASSTFDQVTLNFSPFYTFIGFGIAIICTTLPAYLVANRELKEKTAQLLVAKPPKKGSRILLERITPIWNRMSFTYKVTARNLFRYKKRMFMTIFGVAGCAALLVTGFGIRDSLTGIVDHQFDDLVKYDLIVSKNDDLSDDEQEQLDEKLDQSDISNDTDVHYEELNVRAGENNDTQDITMLVPDDERAFDQDVEMVNRQSQKQLSLPDDGAIFSEKLADLLGAEKGDTVSLDDEDGQSHSVKVAGVTEMYMGHYIYMNQEAYQNSFDSAGDPNGYLVTLNNTTQDNIDEQSSSFMDLDGVQGVVQSSAISEQIDNVIDGLNNVILVLITCATLLALVVIYNLTNINVSERIRELSTIKVLGFYDREVTMYIYRETILLSILGILAGYVVGYYLHGFIMQTLPPDDAMFSPGLQLSNFILSAGITLLITFILMFVIHRKLKNIDMLEALQSAD
ncbi:ABC transporter permease [Tetragenococcus halophilus]|uniref:ABC transporter permease n=1 Tax=Tetragenococcus halophilus TaxID=51669 RepID=UPI000CC7CE2C|nr:ABC transporter permease [Tetragenococcus halophilus]MDN6502128.1 FtsX-like permease family protein [Tetragenococcus koreensis]MCO8284995.1 FtsX-like permease family protein [Tetragenococcus halophilus]MCO8287099.1 FtsX-like permease family protein [Tetragenococcus halophilus]GBD65119.1 putative ABC transporter permease protein [Tetragenococcus halophilus subsp. halophilus]GBD77931.1 putative ABC transporter permease protein [Tetragenococcus halophilus subsp. halophilus]